MPSPPDSHSQPPALFEKQIAVADLCRLSATLARSLGELGTAGETINAWLGESVEAECVSCGMRLRGEELIAVSVLSTGATGLSEKLKRLQLGYCARKACHSHFYVVRFAERPGVDWSAVWARAEACAGEVSEKNESDDVAGSDPVHLDPPAPLSRPWFLARLRKPATFGALSLLTLLVLFRSGCRVPGLFPEPRVFIVPAISTPESATNR